MTEQVKLAVVYYSSTGTIISLSDCPQQPRPRRLVMENRLIQSLPLRD